VSPAGHHLCFLDNEPLITQKFALSFAGIRHHQDKPRATGRHLFALVLAAILASGVHSG
jgi:hypothetical protein